MKTETTALWGGGILIVCGLVWLVGIVGLVVAAVGIVWIATSAGMD